MNVSPGGIPLQVIEVSLAYERGEGDRPLGDADSAVVPAEVAEEHAVVVHGRRLVERVEDVEDERVVRADVQRRWSVFHYVMRAA